MNTIIWKGVPSTTIDGLLICELPPITKPPLRVKETTIDGRDGSISEDLGFGAYDKSISIGLRGNFDINKVIKYFTGEGEIVFSNEPDKVYTAKVIGQIDYNRLLRFRTAVVTFRVQPFKHKYNEAHNEPQAITATGTSIVVPDVGDAKQRYFSIYGKTTQNGTPTPDSPVELVSIGESGSITVDVGEQSMTIATPNGLRGIPVTSGGNYTDANGQQWICDEIDLAKGVYVQRVCVKILDGTEGWEYENNKKYFVLHHSILGSASVGTPYCSHFVRGTTSGSGYFFGGSVGFGFYHVSNSVSKWQEFLSNHIANGTPVELVCCLATPVETALTEEEIATYKTLNEQTTITNDGNAHMKLEYFKTFEVFNEGLENSKPRMELRGKGTVGISVNGIHFFDYTFPEGEREVVIDSEKEDAYLGNVLKNRNMNGEFPVLLVGTNKIEWSGYVESIEILPRSRWL